MVQKEMLSGAFFLAFPSQLGFLLSECENRLLLSTPSAQYGDLVYYPDFNGKELPYWCATAMTEPFLLRFDSIGEAASALRNIQRSWASYQFTCFRRAALIQEKLPHIQTKPRAFPFTVPQSPIGLYTLIDSHTMLCSAKTTSPFPLGRVILAEDHVNPPSRAYLKLEEALLLSSAYLGASLPSKESTCFEAGASPGGWTWVLTELGASVTAVDRAPLSAALMEHPLVHFVKHDAFTLKPLDIGPCDWVLSDVICYPERLLSFIEEWVESGLCKHMVCTIKMQGAIDWPLIARFAAIPNSRIVHLAYNKHELTFLYCGESNDKSKA